MKNRLILVAVILVSFVAGTIVGNLFEVRLATAKGKKVRIEFEGADEKGLGVGQIKRAKVFGGWLVLANGQGLTFVSDPNHQWQ